MKKITFVLSILFLICSPIFGNGDHYESTGKLMTVVACVAVILVGIVFFLFYLERRVSKMEGDHMRQEN